MKLNVELTRAEKSIHELIIDNWGSIVEFVTGSIDS